MKMMMIGFFFELIIEWSVQIAITFMTIYYFNKLNRKYPDFKLTQLLRRVLSYPTRLVQDQAADITTPDSKRSDPETPNRESLDEMLLTVATLSREINAIATMHDDNEISTLIRSQLEEKAREILELKLILDAMYGNGRSDQTKDITEFQKARQTQLALRWQRSVRINEPA